MFNFLGIIAVIAFLNFWTLVPTLVLYLLFLGMRWIYLSTSRDLKRLEGIKVLSGEVGLAISLAMMLSGMFQWGVRQSAEVENQMTSVERILEYTNIKPEVNGDVKTVEMPKIWPSRGEISFENVFLCYREGDPPVLKNLNFTINPAEKIGIVGRTGAGKSSILACLFRLTQPQGYIKIDNVSTDTLQLEDLRKSISIIPQDPALISGSVRRNVDPFEEYKDEEIWNALEEVHLKNAVLQMPFGLYSKINEGGSNLSVGQRQLVCLARAILKKNKILVMDEPTSNVDAVTDSLVQNTLRIKFSDCTVLTIAHRINSIMNSDKVMVMDGGKLVEFASPHDLLKNENSTFALLVSQLGSSPQLVKKESNEVQEHEIEKPHKN
ncbi:Multidrug resistance-associated protein 4 [Armadillidium vulgare]|nr:Multidrug resistance-associated protein 4 [Armadillidium vulgare]